MPSPRFFIYTQEIGALVVQGVGVFGANHKFVYSRTSLSWKRLSILKGRFHSERWLVRVGLHI